jgi:hypothetical protein
MEQRKKWSASESFGVAFSARRDLSDFPKGRAVSRSRALFSEKKETEMLLWPISKAVGGGMGTTQKSS